MKLCSVDNCDRHARAHGWCNGHYQRQRNMGDVHADRPLGKWHPKVCSVEGCGRPHAGHSYCNAHLERLRITGDVQADKPIRSYVDRSKTGRDDGKGYVIFYRPDHPNAHPSSGMVAEHVVVMVEHLGRPLQKGECVHHINGVRDDNRLENLELWTRAHPPGQRVTDIVAWAREILALYAPSDS